MTERGEEERVAERSNERSRVVLLGGNAGGCAMLDLLLDEPLVAAGSRSTTAIPPRRG